MKLYRKTSMDRLLFVMDTLNKKIVNRITINYVEKCVEVILGTMVYQISYKTFDLEKLHKKIVENELTPYML